MVAIFMIDSWPGNDDGRLYGMLILISGVPLKQSIKGVKPCYLF